MKLQKKIYLFFDSANIVFSTIMPQAAIILFLTSIEKKTKFLFLDFLSDNEFKNEFELSLGKISHNVAKCNTSKKRKKNVYCKVCL